MHIITIDITFRFDCVDYTAFTDNSEHRAVVRNALHKYFNFNGVNYLAETDIIDFAYADGNEVKTPTFVQTDAPTMAPGAEELRRRRLGDSRPPAAEMSFTLSVIIEELMELLVSYSTFTILVDLVGPRRRTFIATVDPESLGPRHRIQAPKLPIPAS